MPLNRYQIRNEYSLADPDLYKVADKDDPEALLEGVAMAGLVGVLRQLGDLAEFAAEIFHDLHEEVMATAARGHGLIVRVQQLEAEFPSVERTLLSQTSHTTFLYNSGIDCHPNLRMDQNLVTQGDLPRFVMDSYEECRGPPRLFLLDKYDVAGAGACLKRFTDPSFFKAEATSTGRKSEGQREKKTRRVKKRGQRWRNGDTPETFSSSHAKLHQLFLEERIETGGNDPDRRVKLKTRQFTGSLFDQNKAKSYMEKFLDTCPPEQKIVHEICIDALPLTWTSGNGCESGLEIVEIGTVSPLKESIQTDISACSSPDTMEMVVKPSMDDFNEGTLSEIIANHESDASKISSTISKVSSGEEFADEESKSEVDGQNSDDVTSEIDSYMDALATIESELETDSECKNNPRYLNLKPIVVDSDTSEGKRELQSFDAQSFENSISSEDGNYFFKERASEDSNNFSVSVETLAETIPDLDAALLAAASVPASSNTDLDKVPFDHHSMSEKIPGNKSEEYTARGTVAVEADDGSKSMQGFGEASNISRFTDQNSMILPVDMEENCIPIPDLDEVHSSSAEPDFTSGVSDQRHANQTATWSCNGTVADAPERTDSGHLSCGEHTIHDTTESKRVDSVPSSVDEHSNDLGIADADFCIPSTEGHSASQSSVSDSTQGFNIQEHFSEAMNLGHTSPFDVAAGDLPNSQEDPSIKEVISDVQCEEEAPCVPIVGQTEAGIADLVSLGKELNSELLPGSADGEMKGNSFIQNQPPALDPSETQDQWQKQPEKTGEGDHNDKHDDKNEAFSHDTFPFDRPTKLVSDTNSVLAGENILDLHHDMANFEHIEVGTTYGSSQVDTENYHHENDIPLSSSSSPIHEKVQEHHVQKFVESVEDPPENLNSKMCNMSSDESPTSELLDGGLANNVQKNEKSDVAEAPLTSESSSQDVESTNGHYFSKSMIPPVKGLDLLDGESKVKPLHAEELSSQSNNYTKQIQTPQYVDREGLVNTSSLSSQPMVKSTLVFPVNDMLNGNNQPSEEVESAPPLPPLPPMQWRLSRFQNSFATPQRQLVQHTIGPVQQVPSTVSEISSENNINGIRRENNEPFTILSTSIVSQSGTHISADGVTSLDDMNGIRRDDNLFLTTPSTSTNYQIGNQISGESSQPRMNPCEPGSLFQGLSSGHTPAVVEVKADAEIGDQDERLEHIPQVTQQEAQNSHVQFLPPSKLLPTPGFVAPEAGNLWSSTYDGIPTNANGTLQKKLPRPRNPLIDEVVAIDKSKLRKVERVKPPVEPKPEEGESLLEQMQLRKVERVKPPEETKAEEGESLLEHLQLRKVGERVKAPVEQKAEQREFSLEQLQLRKVGERVKPQVESKTEERESLLEQFQLRKVGERVKPEVEQKPEETESPRVQLRKVGERVKPEVEQKPEETESPRVQLRKVGERVKSEVEQKPEETESPRVQLRKVGERAHPLVESKTENRDSIFEQIRNKSFNLKPAVVARPNIQGPNIQGPRTNLQVAAILEKASNIRQAMAGSDEEDDADSWSDC